MEPTGNDPIRVLQIDTGKEWRGGQQQVFYLSRELERRGVKSTIVAPRRSPLAGRAADEGLSIREIPYRGAGDPMAIHGIAQAIQETGAQFLHVHTAHAHSLAFLVRRIPGILREGRPALLVHRRVDFAPANDPLTRMRYTSEDCLYLCVSEAVRKVLLGYGLPAEKLRVVHSCIDPARIDASAGEDRGALRREIGVPEETPLIGVVGAFVPHKGHRFLLAALPRIVASLPETRVVLFGDGPLETELRRDCWERGLQDRVVFAGFRSDVARFLHCFDLLAHPSTEEGLGTTILDAMAARLPVVASRAGGIPEVVSHGRTGW
ncbi:MAG: glycosyltransferase, partial [Candidatus Eisenbacteria bacterium]|nr:glycosyltransferase [Candidatus Latescibacterota bacterium]MBD3302824.1 glycosyltransferase [Candidatus Eisenbacteria bacterium]